MCEEKGSASLKKPRYTKTIQLKHPETLETIEIPEILVIGLVPTTAPNQPAGWIYGRVASSVSVCLLFIQPRRR